MQRFRAFAVLFAAAWCASALAGCGHRGRSSALPPLSAAASDIRHGRSVSEAAYPNTVLNDHPAAYYRLDDGGTAMQDSGLNGIAGTYGSAVAHSGSLIASGSDPSAVFAGGAFSTTKLATVPANSLLQPAGAVTVEAWIQEQSANTSGWSDVVSYGDRSGQAYALQIGPTNTVTLFLSVAGTTAEVDGVTALTPGTPAHVVGVYDGSAIKMYVNGRLDATASASGALDYSKIAGSGLWLGAAANSSRAVFGGTLDEVAVYPVALSATQIANHYSAATAAPSDAYAATVAGDRPLAYYRLDDAAATLTDSTANRLNGAYGSAITRNVPGLIVNSTDTTAKFPGGAWSANGIATVPQNALLQPADVTVEAWVRERTANTSGYWDVVSYGDQNGQGYSLQIGPTNTATFFINTAGGSAEADGTTVLTAGSVYHLVGTYTGSNVRIFVNGVLETKTAASGSLSYAGIGAYGLSIGAAQDTGRSLFPGKIDEVAIYGSALTAAQISNHYAIGAPSTPTGPMHLHDAAYYDIGANQGVSVSFMTAHYDIAVVQSQDTSVGDTFRRAGGSGEFYYTDPTTIYYCLPPFGPLSANTPGLCGDNSSPDAPLHDPTLNGDDSAWLHGTGAVSDAPAGARMHKPHGSNYGELLYPGSAHTQQAYRSYTSSVASSSLVTGIWMDDSSPQYGFGPEWGTTAAEYDSQANPNTAYANDLVSLACSSAKPVYFNGPAWNPLATDGSAQTSKNDDLAMYNSPCVGGPNMEGSFVENGSRKTLNQENPIYTFIPYADRMLMAQSMHKSPLLEIYLACSYGGACNYDPLGDRIYGIAGTWLIYDPAYTIVWTDITKNDDPNLVDANGGSDSTLPEYGIVPTQPVQTAANNDITTLQVPDGHSAGGGPPGGVFRREFAQCYQNGISIGACATVVNAETTDYTGGGTVAMPTLSRSYAHALVLTDGPWDRSGTATWTGTVPTSLGPLSAVVLKQ